jgi:hypothetical protein
MILSGAALGGNVQGEDSSNITLGGVAIGFDVVAYNQAKITINGAAIGESIKAYDNSTIVLNGVLVPHTQSSATSQPGQLTHLSGDSQLPAIYLYDNSSLEVDGINLSASLLDPNSSSGLFSEYQVSGSFADGTLISDDLLLYVANPSASNPQGASFTLVAVPEPSAIMLLAIGTVGVGIRRRRVGKPI